MPTRSSEPAADPGWPSTHSFSSPETLRDLVENLREGVYITSADGEILAANPAMLDLFGVGSAKELEGRKVREWLDPLQLAREHAILEQRGVVRDFEFTLRRPGGDVRTVIDTAFTRRDPATGKTLYYGILIDISDRKRLERQLEETGMRDPLTGCFNRRYLGRFEAECATLGWGCVVIDVDHFKDYNDRYGHERGDRVLVRMARFLGGVCRADDAVVRLGGDEFMILLAGMRGPALARLAHRLSRAAKAREPVPFSLGWGARWRGERLEATMVRADRRLIAARLAVRARPARRAARRRPPRPPAPERRR